MQLNSIKLTREDQAKLEIGQTEISRNLAFVLVLAFLFTIYSVPLIQQAIDHRKSSAGKMEQSAVNRLMKAVRPAGMVSLRGLMSINADLLKRINLYQDHLDDSMFLTKALNPALQSFMTGWLKGGNEQAYCGRGEWLFYRPDVEYLTNRGFLESQVLEERRKTGEEWETPVQPDPVMALKMFRDQLEQRGIKLIVIPVPSKPMIYPDKYSVRFEAGGQEYLQNSSFNEFCRRLDDEEIDFFDPTPLLVRARGDDKDILFLKCDTHWTPLGMQLVAGGLADHIRSLCLLDEKNLVKYQRIAAEVNNLGDIASMLKLPSTQEYYHKETVIIDKIMNDDGRPWQSDPEADILFLGDSFANIYSLAGMGWGESAGFVETLSAELQQPIDRIVINNNGSYATRRILSREQQNGIDRLGGKSLVVYEYAVRELSIGDWKMDLDMTLNDKPPRMDEADNTTQNELMSVSVSDLQVRGKVAEITKAPAPGTVPYKDCIISIHLIEMESLSGSLNSPSEALVYAWGMRDNQLTDNSNLKPGQWLNAKLKPWSKVDAQYGSYNRQELDGDALLFLDTYWMFTDEAYPVVNDKDISLLENNVISVENKKDDKHKQQSSVSNKDDVSKFQSALSTIVKKLVAEDKNTWQGRDGWLFFVPEIRSLTVGEFWGEKALEVSRAMNPQYADPLPAIVDFNNQLKEVGIDLWVVPVPQKASIYPLMVDVQLTGLKQNISTRYDGKNKEFYNLLESQGVKVIDLYPRFMEIENEAESLYCHQDTHWSARAIDLAAQDLSEMIKKMQWYEDIPKKQYKLSYQEIEIEGDLWKSYDNASLDKEKINLTIVSEENTNNPGVEDWRESPVMLLGDSHNLVFHVGQEMFSKGAGLPDILASKIGFAVDLAAVRGSGATPARINLLRRRDNMKGKRLVIWCFTAREFTETTDGWRKVPIIR